MSANKATQKPIFIDDYSSESESEDKPAGASDLLSSSSTSSDEVEEEVQKFVIPKEIKKEIRAFMNRPADEQEPGMPDQEEMQEYILSVGSIPREIDDEIREDKEMIDDNVEKWRAKIQRNTFTYEERLLVRKLIQKYNSNYKLIAKVMHKSIKAVRCEARRTLIDFQLFTRTNPNQVP